MSRIAGKFIWSKCGNRSGIHLVNWNDITLDLSEGGLSIKNLKITKLSLMAKIILSYLNSRDAIWVEILIQVW